MVFGITLAGISWFDWATVILIGLYTWQGWERGMYLVLPEWISWVVAWAVGLLGTENFARTLVMDFGLWPRASWLWSFILIVVFVQQILFRILIVVFEFFPRQFFGKRWHFLLGVVPAFLTGVMVIGFIVLVLMKIPIAYPLKQDITQSVSGKWLDYITVKVGEDLVGTTKFLRL